MKKAEVPQDKKRNGDKVGGSLLGGQESSFLQLFNFPPQLLNLLILVLKLLVLVFKLLVFVFNDLPHLLH